MYPQSIGVHNKEYVCVLQTVIHKCLLSIYILPVLSLCFTILFYSVQYYKQTEAYKVTLHYMNTTLTGLFTLECVMKIFSFGFRVCRGH